MILNQLGFMESFIEDLLNIKLIKEGKFILEKKQFSPKEVFDYIIDMFELRAKFLGVSITFKCVEYLPLPNDSMDMYTHESNPAILPSHLLGDSRRLKQVLINLMQNALKFTGG